MVGGWSMSPQRVCFLISSFRPVVGGAEVRTERLASGLIACGVDVAVLTRRYPNTARRENIAGIDVHRLGYPSHSKLGALTYAMHSFWLLATRLRGYSIVHAQSQDTPLLIGLLARLVLGRTLLITVRSDPVRVWKAMDPVRKWLFPRYVDVVVSLSPTMGEQLLSGGVPPEKVICVPSGVDEDWFRPPTAAERTQARAELGLEDGVLGYVYVGRLEPVKGPDLLVDAWRQQTSDARRRLLIVGGGSLEDSLKATVEEAGLRDVTFVGPTDDVLKYLQAADVFVLPSIWEGISNALLEAMAVGIPAIASDVPGNQALVKHGATGMLFKVGDRDSLSLALRAMEDPELRKSCGDAARRFVVNNYSLRASIARHRDLYRRIEQVWGNGDARAPAVI